MKRDPIISEIRSFRDKYARKHGYSIRAIAEDLKGYRIPKSLQPAGPAKTTRKIAH
jgi:hypothetical protein